MVYLSDSKIDKDLYAAWRNSGNATVSFVGGAAIESFHDMKRIFCIDENGNVTTPFYSAELEAEYDRKNNPMPHLALLEKNFNQEFFRKNRVFVCSPGERMPQHVNVLFEQGELLIRTEKCNDKETEVFAGDVFQNTYRKNLTTEEAAVKYGQLTLRPALNSQKFIAMYGPGLVKIENRDQRTRLSYEETQADVLLKLDPEMKTSQTADLGTWTREEYATLTLLCCLNPDNFEREADTGLTREEKKGTLIHTASMLSDSVAIERPGLGSSNIVIKSRLAAQELFREMQNGNYRNTAKMLVEVLPVLAAAFRDKAPSLSLQMSETSIANLGQFNRVLKMIDHHPELKIELGRYKLNETFGQIRAGDKLYQFGMQNAEDISDVIANDQTIEHAKEKLKDIIAKSVLLNLYEKQMEEAGIPALMKNAELNATAQSNPGYIALKEKLESQGIDMARAVNLAMEKYSLAASSLLRLNMPTAGVEKLLANSEVLNNALNSIRNSADLENELGKLHTMEEIRTYVSKESYQNLAKSLGNKQQLKEVMRTVEIPRTSKILRDVAAENGTAENVQQDMRENDVRNESLADVRLDAEVVARTAEIQNMTSQQVMEFAGFVKNDDTQERRLSDEFFTARKDMVTFNNQMEVLLAKENSVSSDFRKLINKVREAAQYPADAEALKTYMEQLKAAAQGYLNAKDNDLYARMNRALGREVKGNRLQDYGQERYRYAQTIIKVCSSHLNKFEKLGIPADYNAENEVFDEPERTQRITVDDYKRYERAVHKQPFNAEAFCRYQILANLKNTNVQSVIENHIKYFGKNYTKRDLEDQVKLMMNTDAMKIMKASVTGNLSAEKLLEAYKASKKYAADFNQEKTMHPAALRSISDSIRSGSTHYLHKSGTSAVDRDMKTYVLKKLDAISRIKNEKFLSEYNEYCEHFSNTMKIADRHRNVISEADRISNINGFSTERTFYASTAIALLFNETPENEHERLMEDLISGRTVNGMDDAFRKAHNLIKYGLNSTEERNNVPTEQEIRNGKLEVGRLAVSAIPKMHELSKRIIGRYGNNLTAMQFNGGDKESLLMLNNVIYDFSQELNKPLVTGDRTSGTILNNAAELQQTADKIQGMYDYSTIIAGGLEAADLKKNMKFALTASRDTNSHPLNILNDQLAHMSARQHFEDSYRNFASLDPNSRETQALLKEINTATLLRQKIQVYLMENTMKLDQFNRILVDITENRKDFELFFPYLLDGSFAASLKPVFNDNMELTGIRFPSSKEEVMKWAMNRNKDALQKAQKAADKAVKAYTKLSSKVTADEGKRILENGKAAFTSLYNEGVLPASGVLPFNSRRMRTASRLLKDVMKAETFKACLDHGIPEATALSRTENFMETNDAKNLLSHPDMMNLENLITGNGIQRTIADKVNMRAPARNDIIEPMI